MMGLVGPTVQMACYEPNTRGGRVAIPLGPVRPPGPRRTCALLHTTVTATADHNYAEINDRQCGSFAQMVLAMSSAADHLLR